MLHDFSLCVTTADKLKFYRLSNNYFQEDIAKFLNISRTQYGFYEERKESCCALEYLEKISSLYNIPVEHLMDDYHKFLYKGGTNKLKVIRKNMKLTSRKFANMFNVANSTILDWEHGHNIPTRKSFNKIKMIFKDLF